MESKKTSNLIREASHAGSWYTDSKESLDKELDKYLLSAKKEIKNMQFLKAIIAPHAGYSYSGPTAGWAYQYLNPKKNLRVFLLGPSHHAYFAGSGVSSLHVYQTPLGNIHLDLDLIEELSKNKGFPKINKKIDEAEHSLEMHLPFIKKVLKSEDFTLIPIIVGNVQSGEEDAFGKVLAKYFDEENTVFVISSDFCHWGRDFDYMYYNKEDGEIYESIEKLDKKGMSLIESHNLKEFNKYLKETDNTICGRDPIKILLSIIANSKNNSALKTKFVKYAQSSKVMSKKESSVSYASAVTFIE